MERFRSDVRARFVNVTESLKGLNQKIKRSQLHVNVVKYTYL